MSTTCKVNRREPILRNRPLGGGSFVSRKDEVLVNGKACCNWPRAVYTLGRFKGGRLYRRAEFGLGLQTPGRFEGREAIVGGFGALVAIQ